MNTAFTDTLTMRVRASLWHRLLIVATHAVAVAVCAALALARPELCVAVPVIAIAGWFAYRRAALLSPNSVRQLRWHADGEWVWQTRGGRWHSGERTHHCMAGTWLVVVTLRPRRARWRRIRCVLFGDSLATDTHRRLRARLTVAPAPDTEVEVV